MKNARIFAGSGRTATIKSDDRFDTSRLATFTLGHFASIETLEEPTSPQIIIVGRMTAFAEHNHYTLAMFGEFEATDMRSLQRITAPSMRLPYGQTKYNGPYLVNLISEFEAGRCEPLFFGVKIYTPTRWEAIEP